MANTEAVSDMDGEARARIGSMADAVAQEFAATRRILSFDEWFELLCKDPTVHARSAAQFVLDAFAHFGRRDVRTPSGQISRHRLFDCEFDGWHRLVGQEEAQNELYDVISGFVRVGRVNKTVILHGPNGSAKSTMLESLQRALEVFCRTERGALYRFAWVFPNRRQQSGGIGFGQLPGLRDALGEETFARLSGDELEARLVDETKDHPIYLIPLAARRRLLEDICAAHPDFVISDAILYGELSHRNRKIYDALLTAHQGDLRKVLQHVQIERFFVSRQYRLGLVTVEPKQTVDARSYPVTGDAAFAHLPPTVAGQALYAVQGDLVDANRGVINFSDLLKRPYEHYKYLLTATETGRVALDHVVLALDMVLCGSANDLDLLEFRALRSGEYQSFRARLEQIRVPFLLDFRVERKIYQEQVGDILRGVHVAPHVTKILALWGVMTRLRRPKPDNYSPKIRRVLERLTPIEKADLYAYGRVPRGLSSEEARELLAAVPPMHQERFPPAVVRAEGSDHYLGDYEGSFGASVRDLKAVLLAAASDPGSTCVTLPRVVQELRAFLKDSNNHRWMSLNPDGAGFHLLDGDEHSITGACWERWLDLSDREMREALGLVDEARYLELFRKYVVHVSHALKKERLFDPVTGELTEPDEKFMRQLEKTMAPDAGANFRADVLSRIGAWALSHPNEDPAYHEIFPDYFSLLREDYYKKQKDTVRKSVQRILELLADKGEQLVPENERVPLSPGEEQNARHALEVLLGAHDQGARRERHTRETLRETLVHLIKARY
ncbi:MAG: serine protein kinase PrkA [Deltaproteobacteria bacterium]|nr:serine protein kinase PrkA [Deltaproteobacteria bacterium]